MILLTLGVLLIGSGVWLFVESPAKIDIPESSPVIYEQVLYTMAGENYELYIYEDGSIIYIEEKGLRFPSPEHPATRTWKTDKFTAEQLDSLLVYLENGGLDKLNDSYYFPGEPTEGGGKTMSDMSFTIIVNSKNLNKKVTAYGYLSPDRGETYPDMPPPLNEIYEKFRVIALATQEVARENIQD